MIYEDERSKKFVFIPFCVICQAFQARGLVKYGWHGIVKPVVEELIKHDLNLIQMPCPESQFEGYEKGLRRDPKGIDEYDTPHFRELCDKLASETMDIIRGLLSNGYQIVAILGVERSPSCGVKIQYTRRGTIRRKGIFMEALKNMLNKDKIKVPFIGIDKKSIKKSVSKIAELCIIE